MPSAIFSSRFRLVEAMIRTSALMGVRAADALEDLFLDRPQQLRLLLQGDVVDVVEVERAAFGQVEAALALLLGAGERAFFVAVEFALDELRREERAADLDEGEAVAVRVAVDRRGQQVLAHARLAAQQHVGVGLGADFDHPLDAVHGGRAADDRRPRRRPRRTARGGRGSAAGLPLPLDPGQQRKDVFVAERLGEEVERPELDRLDRHGNAAVGGHHDDFHVGQRALLDPLQQFDAVELGHLQIGHHHVEPPGGELLEGLLAVGGRDHLVPLRGQIVGQGDAFDLFVVDDQDVQ